MSIILRLLEKRGIKDLKELNPNERAKYDLWMKIIEREVKIDDIKHILKSEIARLEQEWLDGDSKNPLSYIFYWKTEIELKARIKNYKTILGLIEEPDKNKAKLIKYLNKLI